MATAITWLECVGMLPVSQAASDSTKAWQRTSQERFAGAPLLKAILVWPSAARRHTPPLSVVHMQGRGGVAGDSGVDEHRRDAARNQLAQQLDGGSLKRIA